MSTKNSTDVRWKQRFDNFNHALQQLKVAVDLSQQRTLSDLEKQGTIQAFEFCHELSWNVLKDYFEYQGVAGIVGSRDAVREAFNKGLIEDGEPWMEMIKSRNQTSHTYNKKIADEIVGHILSSYFFQFTQLQKKMLSLLKR